MRNHRRNFASGCRAVLIWGLLFYLSLQLALNVVTDHWLPELRDPEYGYKLARLSGRLAEEPGRPLIVILGSSRAGYGFRPEMLPACRSRSGEAPVVFNFAMTGSGPIWELLCLRRLLAAGIRPDRVIVEVLPPALHQEGAWAEMSWLHTSRLGWDDFRLMQRYSDRPGRFWFDWCRARLTPWFSNRFCIMSHYAPSWLPWNSRQDIWLGLDRWGWMTYPNTVLDAGKQHRALEFAWRQYAPALDQFRISPVADRASRELLDLCRQEQIAALLVLMPEGTIFQSWYPPAARAEIDAYLAGLSREYQVPLIDARSWLADSAFFDSHHLHPSGAAAFTERFRRDVVGW